jgi:ferredoxin--NADP+ reductase
MVLRSVGYQSVPLPGVPFDERASVVPNALGRVLGADGSPLPGEYVAGWLKRGPTGVIGTNKSDAAETVRCLLEDLAGGPGAGDVPLPRAGLLRYPEPAAQPGTSAAGGGIDAAEGGIAAAGAAKAGAAAGDWPLAGVLAERGIMPVSYAEWLRIETAETDLAKALGRGERVKLHSREAIWSACRPARD